MVGESYNEKEETTYQSSEIAMFKMVTQIWHSRTSQRRRSTKN
jgi:hypothetical protein